MVILFDQYNLPEEVYTEIFATDQQAVVGKLLIEELKSHDGVMGKTEMSLFANKLHDGTLIETEQPKHQFSGMPKREAAKISYNKRQFYDRILTPMKAMGLIDYDLYAKNYKISERFSRALTKIGIMWTQEMRKRQ